MAAKRVAVIGAGLSGLVTVKELLEEGHTPVCFERAPGLGGVFRFDERDGVIWESCRLTSSGTITAFSDFQVSEKRTEHMPAAEYVAYLKEYSLAFDVMRHIRFDTSVDSLRPGADGGWEMKGTDREGNLVWERFDSVAVCSGLHQHPYIPEYNGQENFTGKQMHASAFRRGEQVAGKKVLIVGGGESSADITAEVARYAQQTVLSLRRGTAAVSRRIYGRPRDYITTRLMHSSPHWLFQTRNPADDDKRKAYFRRFFPVAVADKILQILHQQLWERLPMFFTLDLAEIRARFRTLKLKRQLLKESGGNLHEQFATKDDEFVRCMVDGTCRRTTDIVRFEGNRVIFGDGSAFEPDLVIFCTGFTTKFPFLQENVANADRYLHTFSPEFGDSLAFIGFARPAFGAIPPLAELQARWFALLQSGKLRLPEARVMHDSIQRWKRQHKHIFRAVTSRMDHLVDFTTFCDLLADQIGCKPTREFVQRESRKFRLRFMAGPFVAAQYRLLGPGAKPEMARKLIENLPISHPTPDLANLYLRWKATAALHRKMGPEYAPKLTIEKLEPALSE